MRSSLLCDVADGKLIVISDVSGRPSGPVFKGQAENCLTPEDETDMLLRGVGKYLQIYGAQRRRRAKSLKKILYFRSESKVSLTCQFVILNHYCKIKLQKLLISRIIPLSLKYLSYTPNKIS